MAPEQLAQESSSTKSNIFSLGTCFAMVQALLCSETGKLPWMKAKQRREGFFSIVELGEDGFSRNADRILTLLAQMQMQKRRNTQTNLADDLLRCALQLLIEHKFIRLPSKRPDINDISKYFRKYELKYEMAVLEDLDRSFGVDQMKAKTSDIRMNDSFAPNFNAMNIEYGIRIKIRWTNNLAHHLKLNTDMSIDIFHDVSALKEATW